MIKMTERTDSTQDSHSSTANKTITIKRRKSLSGKTSLELLLLILAFCVYGYYTDWTFALPITIGILSSAIAVIVITSILLLLKTLSFIITPSSENNQIKINRKTIYYFNGPEVVAVAAFKLESVPLRIRGKINYLLRSAYIEKIPLFYFYHHEPVSSLKATLLRIIEGKQFKEQKHKIKEEEIISNDGIWKGALIIGTQVRSYLLPGWQKKLEEKIEKNMNLISASFVSAFPHTKIKRLSGTELEKILRIPFNNSTSFYMLGNEVAYFMNIPPMIEKIIKPVYPAEFISPLTIESDIIIGHSIEPEGMIDNEKQIPVGFTIDQLRKENLLVVGEDYEERKNTNLRLIYEAVKNGLKYVILTTSKDYRCLPMLLGEDKVKILRLGKDFSIDVMSQGAISTDEYNSLLILAFYLGGLIEKINSTAVTLLLQRVYEDPAQRGLQPLIEQANNLLESELSRSDKITIENIRNTIAAIMKDDTYSALSIDSTDLAMLIQNTNVIVIEYNFKVHLNAILQAFLILKILTCGYKGHIVIHLPYAQDILYDRAKEKQGLDLFMRLLKRKRITLHASTNKPASLDRSILQYFSCIVVHKIRKEEDLQVVADILKLEENAEGYYSQARHKLAQKSFLVWLGPGEFLMYRPDISSAIPGVRADIKYTLDIISDEYLDITSRSVELEISKGTILETEFGSDAKDAAKILTWLTTSDLTFPALMTIIDDISPQRVKLLLKRLTQASLVIPNAIKVSKGTQVLYKITQKGNIALNQYLENKNSHKDKAKIKLP